MSPRAGESMYREQVAISGNMSVFPVARLDTAQILGEFKQQTDSPIHPSRQKK